MSRNYPTGDLEDETPEKPKPSSTRETDVQELIRRSDIAAEKKAAREGKGPYEFSDLVAMINIDTIKDTYDGESQFELLHDAFPDAHWDAWGSEGDWIETWAAVIAQDGKFYFLSGQVNTDGDTYEEFPVEWINSHLDEVPTFDNRHSLIAWLSMSPQTKGTEMEKFILEAYADKAKSDKKLVQPKYQKLDEKTRERLLYPEKTEPVE